MEYKDFEMPDNYIVVIGNGFDLAHKLNTKYIDFINDFNGKSLHFKYFKSIAKDLSWIDVEKEIVKLHNQIINFHISDDIFVSSKIVSRDDSGNNIVIEKMIISLVQVDIHFEHNHLPQTLKDLYWDLTISKYDIQKVGNNGFPYYEIPKKTYDQFIPDLTKDYEKFVEDFKEYLLNLEQVSEEHEIFQFQELIDYSKKIFSFNYTTTPNIYTRKKIIHIHGNLKDSIILGAPYTLSNDLMRHISKEIKVIESNNEITDEILNSALSPVMFRTVNGVEQKKNSICHIIMIGHSFGESDWHQLERILRVDSSAYRKVYIFYHDLPAKNEIIINIFEMYGHKEAKQFFEQERFVFIKYPNYTDQIKQ